MTRPRPSARSVVWVVAVVTVLSRYPGAIWPLRPDEAGFLMVARAWDPQPDSLYGTYWVDRPPTIIALTRLADMIGGELFLRLVAALGCGASVLLAAACTRRIVTLAGGLRPGRAAVWVALLVGGLCINPMTDAVSAKGEILGVPVVLTAVLASLAALDADRTTRSSTAWAALAGLAAMLAVGLKQSLVGGLAFGGVVLLGSLATRRIGAGTFGRLATAAVLGAALPVVATIGWAVVTGVQLETLWYAVVGFRADASAVLSAHPSDSNDERAVEIVLLALLSGSLLVAGWLLVNLPAVLRRLPVVGTAVSATVAVDTAGVLLGGSFWPPYLVAVIPSAALALAAVLAAGWSSGRLRLVAPALGVVGLLSGHVASTIWTVQALTSDPPTEFYIGEAVGRAAEPGDDLVVYGGRADIQYASGLPSPYEHLWSLPMRTRDPDLTELGALLRGPDAPTWVVTWVPLDSWDMPAEEQVLPALEERYRLVEAEACGGHGVWLREDEPRPGFELECEEPYRRLLGHPW